MSEVHLFQQRTKGLDQDELTSFLALRVHLSDFSAPSLCAIPSAVAPLVAAPLDATGAKVIAPITSPPADHLAVHHLAVDHLTDDELQDVTAMPSGRRGKVGQLNFTTVANGAVPNIGDVTKKMTIKLFYSPIYKETRVRVQPRASERKRAGGAKKRSVLPGSLTG